MWTGIAHFVFKNRLLMIISLGIITIFMAIQIPNLSWSYELFRSVPDNDPDMIQYENFRQQFGEDGNIIAIGILDSSIYTPDKFYKLSLFSDEIGKVEGVNEVLSLPTIKKLVKDQKEKRFRLEDVFTDIPEEQEDLDSMLSEIRNIKFYSGQIYNDSNGATLILVTIDKTVLNSEKRIRITEEITKLGDQFSDKTHIDLKYAGLPFVRSVISGRLKKEMGIFLAISILISGIILWSLFRSWDAVVFPMIIIFVMVIWAMGMLALFGYKITILTGLLPPIIVVIGIPNSIYLLNKYHQEIEKYNNKARALSVMIRRVGIAMLLTNLTTAIGFGSLIFTKIVILREFGIVSSLNVMATFVVSLVLLPAVLSYLPAPKGDQLKHLDFKIVGRFLNGIDLMVHRQKYTIFTVIGVIMIIAIIGIFRIQAVSFMVDDIPTNSDIKEDLAFFEKNFSGIMPLEIVIDTGRKRGVISPQNLKKAEELENFLESDESISRPISVLGFIKAARQTFYNDNPNFYSLPGQQEQAFIFRYFSNNKEQSTLLRSFMDSTGQVMRISMKMADVGSNRLDDLINNKIKPELNRLFDGNPAKAYATGATLLFVKGNNFLISNLKQSLIIAFILISAIMAPLFANKKIIVLSLVSNLVPILITAGLMGFTQIPFKPSTAIVFSVAFGISVDYSIHFLAKYRQELIANHFFVPVAVSKTIREIGTSMIYSAAVLFAGFVIFVWSGFGGTIVLGKLTSVTLLIAMFTNLIFLPSLLLAFDSGKRKPGYHPLIESYDNFYHEDDDEEINVELIKVDKKDIETAKTT